MTTVRLRGRCPACGGERLFATAHTDDDAVIECDAVGCPTPTLVQELLAKPDQHVHLVKFDEDGYTVQHPLVERVRVEGLFACDLADEFRALREPPGIGMYSIPVGCGLDDMVEVDEADVLFEVPTAPESPEVRGKDIGQRLRDLLPIGALHGIPTGIPVPEGFLVVTDAEVRLPVSDYPELDAVVASAGFDRVLIDSVPHVAINLPVEATQPPDGTAFVLRVR